MLQTQLQEAQRELKEATQQHRDDLAALQEESSSLLQDKMDLQKQVPSSSPPSPMVLPQHSQAFPLPPAGQGEPWPCCLVWEGRWVGHSTEWKIRGCSELSVCLSEPWESDFFLCNGRRACIFPGCLNFNCSFHPCHKSNIFTY